MSWYCGEKLKLGQEGNKKAGHTPKSCSKGATLQTSFPAIKYIRDFETKGRPDSNSSPDNTGSAARSGCFDAYSIYLHTKKNPFAVSL